MRTLAGSRRWKHTILEPKEVDEHSCIVLLLQRCAVEHPGSTQKVERLRRAAPEHVSKAGTPPSAFETPEPTLQQRAIATTTHVRRQPFSYAQGGQRAKPAGPVRPRVQAVRIPEEVEQEAFRYQGRRAVLLQGRACSRAPGTFR